MLTQYYQRQCVLERYKSFNQADDEPIILPDQIHKEMNKVPDSIKSSGSSKFVDGAEGKVTEVTEQVEAPAHDPIAFTIEDQ